jgi:hypothetical protein
MIAIKHIPLTLCIAAVAALSPTTPAHADYAKIAQQETDYIQTHFYDPATKRYFIKYPGTDYSDSWGNGVELALLVDATRYNSAKYGPMLNDFSQGLAAYWNPSGPVPGYNATMSGPNGTDRFYDDNAWLATDFAEAYSATGDPQYLKKAWATQNFVLSGWDDKLGGGIYWNIDKQSKNTCSNGPAATASLLLADLSHNHDQLTWAMKIMTWTDKTLQDNDGLYWDNIDLKVKIDTTKWSYNSAMMIWNNVILSQQLGDAAYLKEAKRIADAALTRWTDPKTGSLQLTEDSPLFTHLLCESLIKLYVATHNIKYLNAVRSEASFAYRYAHIDGGGFSDKWTTAAHDPNEKQSLILSAAAARIFWMLSPCPDVESLIASGMGSLSRGDYADAENVFQQASDSDKENVPARYGLWKALTGENKTGAAAAEQKQLVALSSDPAAAKELALLGWQPDSGD